MSVLIHPRASAAGNIPVSSRVEPGTATSAALERRPPGTVTLPTAAPVIRERLRDEGIRERIAQVVAGARSEIPIAVLTKRLPFRYSGTFPKSENE